MKTQANQDNPLLNLIVNIFLPVMVLNKGNAYLDPRLTLLIALALPLGYGIWDYASKGHKNYVSLLGLVNILLTGGLALLSLGGIWFAVKEASLPFLLGLMVLGSAWTKNPAARFMFCNPQILKMELIETRLSSLAQQADFARLLKKTTLWLSVSFFISSLLNFVLAVAIFTHIDTALEAAAREQALNEQIARMTWMGFAVIAFPLMFFSGTLVYFFLKRLSRMTGENITGLLRN
ncbi:MAG TPA: VC0807 family protein [Bdellovibrionales bacterium]|nr:VC0807 family protein [Bdellovibrionales bacterium]